MENELIANDQFIVAGRLLSSRLLLGTGKYPTLEIMQKCHIESGTDMVTVALRRIPLNKEYETGMDIMDYIDQKKIIILPNTSGAHTAFEVLRLARVAVEMGMKFLKIEVINDLTTLLPDPVETIKSVEMVRKEFTSDELALMIYTSDDPVVAVRLLNSGADAIMPGGSPIGSGRGIENRSNIKMIMELINGKVPVLLDAGIGCVSDVTEAMELGMDGVLLNSAVSGADDPVKMAKAMRYAWISGRLSYLSGRIPRKLYGTASSPMGDY